MDRDPVNVEGRRAVRRIVSADEPLSRARLRTGSQLLIVDASGWGALTELTERLLPGRHLDLHIVLAGGRALVRARVARAFVWNLRSNAIVYRAALAFEHALDVRTDGYAVPERFAEASLSPGIVYPHGVVSTEIVFHDVQSI